MRLLLLLLGTWTAWKIAEENGYVARQTLLPAPANTPPETPLRHPGT